MPRLLIDVPSRASSSPGKAQAAPNSAVLKAGWPLYSKLIQIIKILTVPGKAGTVSFLIFFVLVSFQMTKLPSLWKSHGWSTPLCGSHQDAPLHAPAPTAEVCLCQSLLGALWGLPVVYRLTDP